MGTIVRKAFAQAEVPFRFSVEVRYCNTACVLAESGVGVAWSTHYPRSSPGITTWPSAPFLPPRW